MANVIWAKGPGAAMGATTSADDLRITRFLAGEDVALDRALLVWDIEASGAHVRGLARIGVLTGEESEALCASLSALREAWEKGEFALDERFEDGHSAIEAWLTERLGDTGKKVHTGRSRNDQVLVAQRLFLRDALQRLVALCTDVARVALARAEALGDVPMPGYTHLQRAVPSSLGMWFAAFAEAFLDNADVARMSAQWLNISPLGTAAGYGVNLPLDREGVAQELGFRAIQTSPIYAQNSRGKFELQALIALQHAMMDVRRMAWDLSLFTTAEFGFVQQSDRYTTGSSIMPNKRNPDVVELLRAAVAPVQGAVAELQAVLSLPSGYHRDLQATKGPVLRATHAALSALELIPDLLADLRFDEVRMREAIDAGMYATDRAVELTAQGVPFREAYRQTAGELDQLGHRTPEESLAQRTSPGGAANLGLEALHRRLTCKP